MNLTFDSLKKYFKINLTIEANGNKEVITGIIDTGAQITAIPLYILKRLRIKASGQKRITSIAGSIPCPTFSCTLYLIGRPIYCEVVGSEIITEPLIGLDIIKEYKLTLNWKNKSGEIEDP
ncbi:hypothetical protein HRbin06_00143 [archaeon HR06]|nr:hypothetical protein HRbin06_00143 [archaeon HR06]